MTSAASAAIAIDGSRDAAYGTPIVVQTNNTGFGDNNLADGNFANGSELDAAYALVENGYLNLLFTGNIETNFNHLNIFIDDGRNGQGTLQVANNQMAAMNGSRFSPNFVGTYALDINGGGGAPTWFTNRYDLTQANPSSSFVGQFDGVVGQTANVGGILMSVNNSNTAGVIGGENSAANQTDAANVTTGFELAIPLSQLGSPNGSLKVLVDVNGNNDGFLSNQFLKGLAGPSANVGNGGKFDFSGTADQFFTVTIPAGSNINGVWASTGGGSFPVGTNWTGGLVPAAAGDSALFGSAITGAAIVTLDGSRTIGQITFNNANSYTITPGTGGALTIDDTGDAGGVNPQIVSALGSHSITAPINLAGGVNLVVSDNASLSLSGNISGAGPVVKSGGGLVSLTGNNSWTGDLVVLAGAAGLGTSTAASSGQIQIGDVTADTLPATINITAAGLTIANQITTNVDLTTFDNLRIIAGTYSGGNSTISGTINLNGGVVFSAAAGGTLTVSGKIQDGADTQTSVRRNIHINGAGTVVLTNVETNTGETTVDGGTLVLASGAALAGPNFNVLTGGTAFVHGTLPATVAVFSSGTLHFDGNTTGSPVALNIGSLNVGTAGLVTVGQSTSSSAPVVLTTGLVDFTGDFTGKLDLTNNRMLTTNTPDTVRQQLLFGNIFTSVASATLGYKDNGGGQTVVQFALAGDADLNGSVDTVDFNLLSASFSDTGKLWVDGDFNYDGSVDSVDFNLLASNFGNSTPAPALGSMVPEPTAAALLALSAGALLSRRRRN
jgi:autotransporter-associated beta strand protein